MPTESVRDSVTKAVAEERSKGTSSNDEVGPIGLVENPDDVPFQCATCDYFDDGICDNPRAKLHGKPVEGRWCCDWYDHPGMRVIIR